MRITQKMVMKNQTKLLSRNLNNASKSISQISSGKKYTKISDNPVEIAKALSIKAKMGSNEVYDNNIKLAVSENDTAELAILEVNSTLQRIREVLSTTKVAENVDTFEQAAVEIEQLAGNLVDHLNISFADNYLFSGTETDTKPFSIVADGSGNPTIVKAGNDDAIQVEIADGVKIDKNITGTSLFTYDGGTTTLSTTINNIITDLRNDDKSNVSTHINQLNQHESNVLTGLAKIGARTERYENMQDTHTNFTFKLQDRLSEIEDTDIDKAYIEYTSYQMAYEASIAAVSKLNELSLLSILR